MPRQDGARQLCGGAAGSYSQHASLARLGPGPGPGPGRRPVCLGGWRTAGCVGCDVTGRLQLRVAGRPTNSPPAESL